MITDESLEPSRGIATHAREPDLTPGTSVRLARARLQQFADDHARSGGHSRRLNLLSPLGAAVAVMIGGFVLARVPAARTLARFAVVWATRGVIIAGTREIVRTLAARR